MAPQTKNILEPPQTLHQSHRHLQTVAHRAYSGHKSRSVNDQQIADLLPMVHKIARRIVTYLRPPLSYEDLVSAGTVGLVKAARNFDPSRQADFKTYAYIRIKGAILDELRGWSFVPTDVNKQIRQTLQLSLEITEQTGATPPDTELAEKLGVPLPKLYEIFENARAQYFLSIDGFADDLPPQANILASSADVAPDVRFEQTELINKLSEAIAQLNQRERQIILLYYHQNLTMKQIAEIFEVTESRVSQLHAAAIFNLSVKLRHFNDSR